MQRSRNLFIRLAPRLVGPEGRLTYSAAQLAKRAAVGIVGLILGVAGFTLLTSARWEEVLSGASWRGRWRDDLGGDGLSP
jgi:hypothetical protein